jgi:Fic family protein
LACRVFEVFLRIHPYANGNGHAARFLIWCLLSRYGYWPKGWPIEPRPPDPPYTHLISEYRNGNWEPLEEFVLKTVA